MAANANADSANAASTQTSNNATDQSLNNANLLNNANGAVGPEEEASKCQVSIVFLRLLIISVLKI